MNVYILLNDQYSDMYIAGAFLTLEDAQAAVPGAEWVDYTSTANDGIYTHPGWAAHDPTNGEVESFRTACRDMYMTEYRRNGWNNPQIQKIPMGEIVK